MKKKELIERFGLTKENIIPIFISVTITTIAALDSKFFGNHLLGIVWILATILFIFLLLLIMITAGFTVIKSLFRISAGLSLVIFLAQSYCAVPHSLTGDNALVGLLGIAFLYMLFDFFSSLYKALVKNVKKIEGRWWSLDNIILILLFILFASFYVWAIYQVIHPIILNLCVYKK